MWGVKMCEICQRIKELRKNSGYSQTGLAESLGLTQRVIGAIETGETLPSLVQLELLANFFGVSFDYLIRGIEAPAPEDLELLKIVKENGGIYSAVLKVAEAKKKIESINLAA